MEFDLSKINSVHFVGIGGIGISAIARMMVQNGKKVTGQDMQDSEIIQELKKLGIQIKIGQSFENIPKKTDLIVYTIAIDNYDSELAQKIKSGNIPAKSYPEMLGEISKNKYTIAVSGTHGKTTTTGMVAQILVEAQKDPTVVVGSLLKNPSNPSKQANFIAGKSDIFVVEACEYKRSFLNVNPKILVITNIDADHLDYYKDIEDIKNAFHELAMKVPADGFIICDPNDKNISDVLSGVSAKIIDYQKYFNFNLKLKIPGLHNKKDGACAVAVADILEINLQESERFLENFPGTWRRFEYKGEITLNRVGQGGAKLYDDYAHHPTEIISTLEGFRELYPRQDGWKLIVIFQPHLFSRTKLLLNDFAKSFSQADMVLLLPIYFAREVDDGTISSQILAEKINENNNNTRAFPDFDITEAYLRSYLEMEQPNIEKNIVITMGAGEAFKIGDKLLEKSYNKDMENNTKKTSWFNSRMFIGLGLIISTLIAGAVFYQVRSFDNTLTVTGSTTKQVTSDHVKWSGQISRIVKISTLKQGYTDMARDLTFVKEFLKANSIPDTAIVISPVFMDQNWDQSQNTEKTYTLRQTIEINSDDVGLITNVSKDTQSLIDKGVIFSTQFLEYTYTKLPEERVAMLGDAIKDAKARASRLAESSGKTVGQLKSASSGVVQVMSANSNEVSDYGMYDTSKIEKTIMLTVKASFTLR